MHTICKTLKSVTVHEKLKSCQCGGDQPYSICESQDAEPMNIMISDDAVEAKLHRPLEFYFFSIDIACSNYFLFVCDTPRKGMSKINILLTLKVF